MFVLLHIVFKVHPIHTIAHSEITFLSKAEEYPTVCSCQLFTHSSIGEHLGCVCLLPVVNEASMNVGVQMCTRTPVPALDSFGVD